jgi:mono/diheme cytochrome c family protein
VKASRSSVRRPFRAILPTLTVLVLVGGVASGCGGDSKKATNEPPPTTTTTTTTTIGTAPGAGQSASGAKLFSDNCESCHGTNGAGGHIGPNLQNSAVAGNLAKVEKQVRNGKGAMPPFKGVLSGEEIDVVAHYVVEQIAPKG